MILVAGPYRSGTDGDPARIQANVDAMTATALALFRRGHLPVMGEWFALPLIEAATAAGDADADETIFHPVAEQVLARCDGCLRIDGRSAGADRMVETARRLGKSVWRSIDDVPRRSFSAVLRLSSERNRPALDGWRVPVLLDHEARPDGVRTARDVEIRTRTPIEPGGMGDVQVFPLLPDTWRTLWDGEELDVLEPPSRVVATLIVRDVRPR